jgi:hypothetical protein
LGILIERKTGKFEMYNTLCISKMLMWHLFKNFASSRYNAS